MVVLAAADVAVGALTAVAPGFRRAQDPRQRILWDARHRGSPVVLIGDSVFCSYYVDSLRQTLWERLSERLGVPVFPAVLDGATPLDMLLMARIVAEEWPAGTTVFIDVHPARLFAAGPVPYRLDSQYTEQFKLLVHNEYAAADWLHLAERRLVLSLARRSFLVRNREWIVQYLGAVLGAAKGDAEEPSNGNQRWDADDGFAYRRFRSLEASLTPASTERLVSFEWVRSLDRTLRERGLDPVFVLTPLNVELVTRYSEGSTVVPTALAASREYLLGRLLQSGIRYLDLYEGLDSAAFSDAIHTNARGDDALTAAMGRWVRARGSRIAERPGP